MREDVIIMAEVFKALGDPKRLKIIRVLASNPRNTLSVSDLANRLGISQPAVSQHIKILKSVGILEANKVGFHVYYHTNLDTLTRLRGQMEELFELVMQECDCGKEERLGGNIHTHGA